MASNPLQKSSEIQTDTSGDSVIVTPSTPPRPQWQQKLFRYVNGRSIIAIFFIASMIGIASQITKPTQTKFKAAAGQASISLLPATITVPPEKTMQVWATVDKPVGFISVDITFDPTKLVLTQEPTFTAASTNVCVIQDGVVNQPCQHVSVTKKADANSSGHIIFVTGVDPTNQASAPTGTFQIGTLAFTNKSTLANDTSAVMVSTSTSQFVDTDAVPFTVKSTNASVSINPSNTPTPTLQPPTSTPMPPTPTMTPIPTPVAATRTPTPIPTSVPTTPSPTPIVLDTTAPIVVINKPEDNATIRRWRTLRIKTTAYDARGIKTIKISLDDKVIRTCTDTSTCNATRYANWRLRRGKHTIKAEAWDTSGNKNSKTIQITIR